MKKMKKKNETHNEVDDTINLFEKKASDSSNRELLTDLLFLFLLSISISNVFALPSTYDLSLIK